MNLAQVRDFETALPFVNIFNQAKQPWSSTDLSAGDPLDNHPTLSTVATDNRRWPVLQTGQGAATTMNTGMAGHYPTGDYVLTYEGIGDVEVGFDAITTDNKPNRIEFNVPAALQGIYLRILQSDINDPVRNIRITLKGLENTASPFYSPFLNGLRNFSVIRFKDWQQTDNTATRVWEDMPTPEMAQTTELGVSVEYMIEICNELRAHPWFTIPHTADDAFITNFAQTIKNFLDPKLNVYVEWSHEVWNSDLPQFDHVTSIADADPSRAFIDVQTDLMKNAFSILRNTFSDNPDRVIRVVGGETGSSNANTASNIVNNMNGQFDAIAIDGYFRTTDCFVGMTAPDVISKLDPTTELQTTLRSHKQLVNTQTATLGRRIPLLTYEAGQHQLITATVGSSKCESAWRNTQYETEMYDKYVELIDLLKDEGVDLFNHNNYISQYSEINGYFGTSQFLDQTGSDAPKWDAILDKIDSEAPGSFLGMNLYPVTDWSPEIVWANIFLSSSPWISQHKDGINPWNDGRKIEVNSLGYPILLNDQAAATVMLRGIEDSYPAGTYVCTFDGDGDVTFDFSATVISQQANRVEFNVTPSNTGILMRITRSNPSDRVRNIKVWLPGFENAASPFFTDFRDSLEPFDTLKFTEWQRANEGATIEWNNRTIRDQKQVTNQGVAIEYMVDLCNDLSSNAWFNIPHLADNDYITNFATFLRDNLDSSLRIYVEWSNEVWNTLLPVNYWTKEQAESDVTKDFHDIWAEKTKNVFDIFDTIFAAEPERITKVIAGQQTNVDHATQLATKLDTLGGTFDAIACGAYTTTAGSDGITVADIITALDVNTAHHLINGWQDHKVLTDTWSSDTGLRKILIAYEGGQHLTTFGLPPTAEVTWEDTFNLAQIDPRMYNSYADLIQSFRDAGGSLFMHYTYLSPYDQWGSWGAREGIEQTELEAPKWEALNDDPDFLRGPIVDEFDPTDSFVGMNLTPLIADSEQMPFANIFLTAQGWVSQPLSGPSPFDDNRGVDRDATDWPILKPDQAAAVQMLTGVAPPQNPYPSGTYICTHEGDGDLDFFNDAILVSRVGNTYTLNVNPTSSGIMLRVIRSEASNRVINIKLWLPGYEDGTRTFYQPFLDSLTGIKTVRFMDWMKANQTFVETWSQRANPESRQISDRGVSIEHMVRLCNNLKINPWFTIPHAADDTFITNFASFVKDNLHSNAKIYLEYSNEVWNDGRGLRPGKFIAAIEKADPNKDFFDVWAEKMINVFDIFEQVFDSQSSRIVRILAGRANSNNTAEQLHARLNGKYDAIALGAYIGTGGFSGITLDRIFSGLQNGVNFDNTDTFPEYKALVDQFSTELNREIKFFAYEGGLHILGMRVSDPWFPIFLAAQSDDRMNNIYVQQFQNFQNHGGTLFMHYYDIANYQGFSFANFFGSREFLTSTTTDSPKYKAIVDINNAWMTPAPVNFGSPANMKFYTRYTFLVDTAAHPYITAKYLFKKQTSETANDYAQRFLTEFSDRNDGKDVWAELWAVGGNYKTPIWVQEHYLLNAQDATPQGTPGIWPKIGIAFWNDFIKELQNLLEPLSPIFWNFDNETHLTRFSDNMKQNECFRNIVLDPRWLTEPLLGIDLPGATFLDPSEVTDTVARTNRSGNTITDSLIAIQMIEVLGSFIRNEAFRRMVDGISGRYGDWGNKSFTREISWPLPDPLSVPGSGHEWAWNRVSPWLQNSHPTVPGVAPYAILPMYGPGQSERDAVTGSFVDFYEQRLIEVEKFYSPGFIKPAISMPNYKMKDGTTNRWLPGEYAELMPMLLSHNIAEVMVFNPQNQQSNADELEFLQFASVINA